MTIKTRMGIEILIDEEDERLLDDWSFVSVIHQKKCGTEYRYPLLFGEKDVYGRRVMRYLAREVMGIHDPTQEVLHINGNGCDCRKENLVVKGRSWKTRNLVNA